jgi:hypothetical protein
MKVNVEYQDGVFTLVPAADSPFHWAYSIDLDDRDWKCYLEFMKAARGWDLFISPIFLAMRWFWKRHLCPRCHYHRGAAGARWEYMQTQLDPGYHLLSQRDRLARGFKD